MTEQQSRGPHVPPTDADLMSNLIDLSHRLFDQKYTPPFKIGEAFMDHFLNKHGDEKSEEFHFVPNQGSIDRAFEDTVITDLGANYDCLLYYQEISAGLTDERWRGLERFSEIKHDVEQVLDNLSTHVAKLEEDPTYTYVEALSTYIAPTRPKVEEALRKANSGEGLIITRYGDENLEDVRQLVARQALLRSLGFNLHWNNTIVRAPNFAARGQIGENTMKVVELWWGWGNPHIFYAKSSTEIQGDNPQVSLAEKLVVASAYHIAKYFSLIHTEPQDIALKYPADPQPTLEANSEELKKFVKEIVRSLSNEAQEK